MRRKWIARNRCSRRPDRPRRYGLCTFEFGFAVEVLKFPRPEFVSCQFAVVAAEGRRARATGGIVIEADARLNRLDEASTMFPVGVIGRSGPQLLKAISQASKRGARCLSICSACSYVLLPSDVGARPLIGGISRTSSGYIPTSMSRKTFSTSMRAT